MGAANLLLVMDDCTASVGDVASTTGKPVVQF
jgi:hypothetical protein